MPTHSVAKLSVQERYNRAIEELHALRALSIEQEQEIAVLRAKSDNRRKLTKREVREIKRFWENRSENPVTQRELADWYGVNPGTISRIVNGKYHADL
jgi:DNA-binding XRE family transcriptional regulator